MAERKYASFFVIAVFMHLVRKASRKVHHDVLSLLNQLSLVTRTMVAHIVAKIIHMFFFGLSLLHHPAIGISPCIELPTMWGAKVVYNSNNDRLWYPEL